MVYERVRAAKARTVGTKQTIRAVEKGLAKTVFIARNAEERIVVPLVRLCRDKGVELVWVNDMVALGKACGIGVGTASAAITAE